MAADLVWNVYTENINARKIEKYNIFEHMRFMEDLKKNRRKNRKNRNEFCKQLKSDLMYYFWSKAQWEIIMDSWLRGDRMEAIKISAYDQVMMNWHAFTEYVCNALKIEGSGEEKANGQKEEGR